MEKRNNTHDILQTSRLKENPFGVPGGYFASVKESVMEQIPAPETSFGENQEREKATFMTYFKPALSLAAVFAIVFGMGWSVMKVTEIYAPEGLAQTEEIQLTEEEELISILDISLETLISAENSTEEIAIDESLLNTEEIEQYLIDTRLPSYALALVE